jgi:release factor glutamine methyltransferase
MVEKVLEEVEGRRSKVESLVLVDVGTGSGCIPISIMKTFPPQADQPRAEKYESIKTYAIDISTKALKIARKNAEQHKVKIEFLSGNLLEPFLRLHNNITMKQHNNEVIILTANLPYLTYEQFKNEPSIQHEPYLALVAEEQGLQLYKELLQQIKKLLVTHNLQLVTFFEIDPSQTALIISEIKKSLPAAQVDVIPDLAGRDRVIKFSIVN